MPHVTHIQRLGRLARELAAENQTDVDTAILAMSLTPWHVELASIVSGVPAPVVQTFCDLHRVLTSKGRPGVVS